jgi:hypothetical protein
VITRPAFIPVRLFLAAVMMSAGAIPAVAATTSGTARNAILKSPAAVGLAQAQAAQAQGLVNTSSLLRSLPVTGILSDGGVFSGTATITSFSYVATQGLSASGTLSGTATTLGGTPIQINAQTFTDVKAPLVESLVSTGTGGLLGGSTHQVLSLDLGPVSLAGGLIADVSAVAIDVTSLTGVDATLGNLLWTVATLLDPLGIVSDLFLPLLGTILALINPLLGSVL